jgi:hypothetical protein
MKKLFIVSLVLLSLSSCTDNQRARKWGGIEDIKLDPDEKFINISWQGDNLWVITQDTATGVYYAREKSSLGMMEGKLVIHY